MDPVFVTIAAVAGFLVAICIGGMAKNWHRRAPGTPTQEPLIRLTWPGMLVGGLALVAAIGLGFWFANELPQMQGVRWQQRRMELVVYASAAGGVIAFFLGWAGL